MKHTSTDAGRQRHHGVVALLAGLLLALGGCATAEPASSEGAPDSAAVATPQADRPRPSVTPSEASVGEATGSGDETTGSTEEPGEAPEHGDGSKPQGIHPERIRIPGIGVDADVIDLGLNPDRTLEVPEDFAQTGWWTGGAMPGEAGPAVIVGHVDSRSGPAVFYHLSELQPGTPIEVAGPDGDVVRFQVEHLEQHPKNDFPTAAVYGDTDEPTLRLITCGGSFDRSIGHYRDNVIVYASLAT